jgi:hypothetical protein
MPDNRHGGDLPNRRATDDNLLVSYTTSWDAI